MKQSEIVKEALDEVLIINCLGTTDHCETIEEAKQVILNLIEWEIKEATDPQINGGYKLVKVDKEEE